MDTKKINQYTVTDFAATAGVTVSYVRQLLRARKIKGIKLGARAWVLPASELSKLAKLSTESKGRKRISEK